MLVDPDDYKRIRQQLIIFGTTLEAQAGAPIRRSTHADGWAGTSSGQRRWLVATTAAAFLALFAGLGWLAVGRGPDQIPSTSPVESSMSGPATNLPPEAPDTFGFVAGGWTLEHRQQGLLRRNDATSKCPAADALAAFNGRATVHEQYDVSTNSGTYVEATVLDAGSAEGAEQIVQSYDARRACEPARGPISSQLAETRLLSAIGGYRIGETFAEFAAHGGGNVVVIVEMGHSEVSDELFAEAVTGVASYLRTNGSVEPTPVVEVGSTRFCLLWDEFLRASTGSQEATDPADRLDDLGRIADAAPTDLQAGFGGLIAELRAEIDLQEFNVSRFEDWPSEAKARLSDFMSQTEHRCQPDT